MTNKCHKVHTDTHRKDEAAKHNCKYHSAIDAMTIDAVELDLVNCLRYISVIRQSEYIGAHRIAYVYNVHTISLGWANVMRLRVHCAMIHLLIFLFSLVGLKGNRNCNADALIN